MVEYNGITKFFKEKCADCSAKEMCFCDGSLELEPYNTNLPEHFKLCILAEIALK